MPRKVIRNHDTRSFSRWGSKYYSKYGSIIRIMNRYLIILKMKDERGDVVAFDKKSDFYEVVNIDQKLKDEIMAIEDVVERESRLNKALDDIIDDIVKKFKEFYRGCIYVDWPGDDV